MEIRKTAVIELTLQETEDLQRAADKKEITLDELLNECFQDAVEATTGERKLIEGNEGLECPKCGNMDITTVGEFDSHCRRCGLKFDFR